MNRVRNNYKEKYEKVILDSLFLINKMAWKRNRDVFFRSINNRMKIKIINFMFRIFNKLSLFFL